MMFSHSHKSGHFIHRLLEANHTKVTVRVIGLRMGGVMESLGKL